VEKWLITGLDELIISIFVLISTDIFILALLIQKSVLTK